MRKVMLINSMAMVMIFCVASFVCASDQLKFPETSDEIIELLQGKEDVVQEINGVQYVYSNGTLYKMMGGKRWKVRGVAGVEAAEMMPRVGAMILFEVGSANISQKSKKLLAEIGKGLSSPQLKDAKFMIEGHTDSAGEADLEQNLSEKRAESVKNYLVKQCKMGSDRLMAVGLGQSKPIASNDTDKGRQRNRRVEIVRMLNQ